MNRYFLSGAAIFVLWALTFAHKFDTLNEHLADIQQELAAHQTVTPDGYHPPQE